MAAQSADVSFFSPLCFLYLPYGNERPTPSVMFKLTCEVCEHQYTHRQFPINTLDIFNLYTTEELSMANCLYGASTSNPLWQGFLCYNCKRFKEKKLAAPDEDEDDDEDEDEDEDSDVYSDEDEGDFVYSSDSESEETRTQKYRECNCLRNGPKAKEFMSVGFNRMERAMQDKGFQDFPTFLKALATEEHETYTRHGFPNHCFYAKALRDAKELRQESLVVWLPSITEDVFGNKKVRSHYGCPTIREHNLHPLDLTNTVAKYVCPVQPSSDRETKAKSAFVQTVSALRTASRACFLALFHGPRTPSGFSAVRPLPPLRYLTNAYGLSPIRRRLVEFLVASTAVARRILIQAKRGVDKFDNKQKKKALKESGKKARLE